MKKLLSIMIAAVVALSLSTLQSCGDDPVPNVLVVIERGTGKIFVVSKSSAKRTELGAVTLNGAPVGEIRAMVYDKATKTIIASSTDAGLGKLYSINPKTLEATVINANPGDDWYGVASLLLTADDSVLAVLWHKTPVTDAGMMKFSKTGNEGPRIFFNPQNVCCGFGAVFGDTEDEVIFTSYGCEVYTSDMDGAITYQFTLTISGFDATSTVGNIYVQSMVRVGGKIYATTYDDNTGDTHLATVDLTAKTVTAIGMLNVGNTTRYHGLMHVSRGIF